jgi:two-component system, LytTR family, sensor histidine kinase AlgZ
MTTKVAPFKHKWAFVLLWTNVTVALVELIVYAVNPTRSAHDLLQSLVFTFVYANLTSILAGVILGWLTEKAVVRGVSPWKIAIPGVLVFAAAGCLLAQSLLAAAGFSASPHFWLDYYHTLRFAVPLALVFGLGAMTHAMLLTRVQTMERELHEKQIAGERSRKLAAETRLRSLESWIHPHFLFNTLNSISALIAIDPARAEQTVGRLATLLRASLDTSSNSLIPLDQEIAMVDSYLDIERVRLGDNLRARVEVPPELRETKVPPMSVQSLVENAVKHGITPQTEGGNLVVIARDDAAGVCVEVADSGPGFDLANLSAGHGLDKLVQRLDALFGDRARLTVLRRDGYSVVQMVLPRV